MRLHLVGKNPKPRLRGYAGYKEAGEWQHLGSQLAPVDMLSYA